MKKTLFFFACALAFGLAANAQAAFSEDFESMAVGEMPSTWTVYADNLTNASSYSSFNNSWQVTTASGQKVAASISWTEPVGNDCDRWLITPAIAIPGNGYSLKADIFGYNPSYPEKVRIMVSTTGTAKTDFTQIADVVIDGNNGTQAGINTVLLSLDNYAGQTVYIAFVNHGDGYYTFVDNIEVNTFPEDGIAMVDVAAPAYAAQNTSFDVTVTVRNTGSMPLTSFDLVYNVNNGDYDTISVTGMNIASFVTGSYTFSVSHAVAEAVTVYVSVLNPNGSDDQDESDNYGSTSLTVYDPANTTTRMSLLEHFTTAVCQYCPGGHERLEQAMANYENKVAWVAHHVGFYTDDFTINESNSILPLYGGSGTWAPAMMVDRNRDYAPGEDGVVASVGDVATLRSIFSNATAVPAFVTVEFNNVTYDPQTRELSVTVDGEFISSFGGTEPRLTLYITEDSLIGRQQSTGSVIAAYQHNHVIRASLTDVWGDNVFTYGTEAGATYSHTFTYTLPTKFRANKCRLVAFVNDYGNTIFNRTVLNANKSGFLMEGTDPTHVGITSVEAAVEVKLYPNPATEMAYITAESTIRSFSMVNAIGQTVITNNAVNADMLEVNVSDLAAGVYYIKVVTDKGIATENITIVK